MIERGQSAGTDGLDGTEGGNSVSDGNTVVLVQWELSVDRHYISAAEGGGRGESCCLRLIGWTIIHGLHLDDAAKGYYMQCWQCMGLFDV